MLPLEIDVDILCPTHPPHSEWIRILASIKLGADRASVRRMAKESGLAVALAAHPGSAKGKRNRRRELRRLWLSCATQAWEREHRELSRWRFSGFNIVEGPQW